MMTAVQMESMTAMVCVSQTRSTAVQNQVKNGARYKKTAETLMTVAQMMRQNVDSQMMMMNVTLKKNAVTTTGATIPLAVLQMKQSAVRQ